MLAVGESEGPSVTVLRAPPAPCNLFHRGQRAMLQVATGMVPVMGLGSVCRSRKLRAPYTGRGCRAQGTAGSIQSMRWFEGASEVACGWVLPASCAGLPVGVLATPAAQLAGQLPVPG